MTDKPGFYVFQHSFEVMDVPAFGGPSQLETFDLKPDAPQKIVQDGQSILEHLG